MAKPSQRIFWDLCSVSFVLCSISFVLCSLSFVLCFVSLVLFSVSMASTDGVQWTLFSLIASCHPLLHCWSKHLHAGSKFYLWGICNWASCHCRVEKCIVERAPFIKTQKKCLVFNLKLLCKIAKMLPFRVLRHKNCTAALTKHRKNCECCPGHHLIVDHYSSI